MLRYLKGYGLKCPGWWECSLAAISQTTTHMHGHHEATMGLAGVSLGRELRALALSHTAPPTGAPWHHLRSQSQSRVQTAPSHTRRSAAPQGHQPLLAEHVSSAKLFLDLHIVSAPSGEERTLNAQPHRSNALDGAAAASTVACTRGVAVPLSWSWSHEPQGRASGCIRDPLNFHPHPVDCWVSRRYTTHDATQFRDAWTPHTQTQRYG